MNDLEAWFAQLATDEKLILVRKLLEGIEADLAKSPPQNVSMPQVTEKKVRPVLPNLNSLDDLPPVGDLEDFNQIFGDNITKSAQKKPTKTNDPSAEIDLLRLHDAAERFHKLLIRYGYVKSPPSLRELARLAQAEDYKLAHQNRKRPNWHDWVTKEDEAQAAAAAAALEANIQSPTLESKKD